MDLSWLRRPSDPESPQCLRVHCHRLEEVYTFWAMKRSGGAAPKTSFRDSYRWLHRRESSSLLPAAQQPLDQYRWTTPGRLAPRSAGAVHRSGSVPEEQGRASQRGRIPYFRSRSEPGTGRGKAGSDGSLLSSITQRISRFLTQRSGPESGRRPASCLS